MNVLSVIKNFKIEKIVGKIDDIEITNLCCDTSKAKQGSMFFCLVGKSDDGHNYAQKVFELGAKILVVERILDVNIPQILVENARKAMAFFASNFYDNPQNGLKLIGVTGTNGKTTCTYIIKNILKNAGQKVGVIGTIGVEIDDEKYPATLTTPDPIELYETFRKMVDSGVTTVAMEVSAHAIYLDKISFLNFDVGILTNVTQDHLDFFGTFDSYINTKMQFFKQNFCRCCIINSDDAAGQELIFENENDNLGLKIYSYGINNPSDAFCFDEKYQIDKTEFMLNINDELCKINTKLIGKFNVYNALASALCCYCLGAGMDAIKVGLLKMDYVKGRINVLKTTSGKNFVIDYAHTPDGLLNVLKAVRQVLVGKMICVFGCGGNRDALKRPIMGKIAAEYSDFTILTNDNPRFEKPMDIISEIEKGVKPVTSNYLCVENREKAIEVAFSMLKKGDVAVICGKGAENYMDIMGEKLPYSDFEVVGKIIKNEK